MELIQILKALGDFTRIRILNILKNGELCVCEIEHVLNISQSNASRHLEKLRNCNLIIYDKRAQWVYYKLNEDVIEGKPFIKHILYNELEKIPELKSDYKKLILHKQSGTTCEDLKKKCNEKQK